MPRILLLMLEFFKTGLFAVGGGLATIPFLQEMSANYGWFSLEELSTMIAVSESTPGAMGINMSTYVGFSQFGVGGSILSTLSLVAPSIIVICIIARYYEKFKALTVVQHIFAGLKPAVVAFVASATISLMITTLVDTDAWAEKAYSSVLNYRCLVFLFVLLLIRKKFSKAHPLWFIAGAAVVGMVLSL